MRSLNRYFGCVRTRYPNLAGCLGMPYGLFILLLFLALGLHYVLVADASVGSKLIVGCVIVASLLIRPWVPSFLTVAIQLAGSAYILMVYKLSGPSRL